MTSFPWSLGCRGNTLKKFKDTAAMSYDPSNPEAAKLQKAVRAGICITLSLPPQTDSLKKTALSEE